MTPPPEAGQGPPNAPAAGPAASELLTRAFGPEIGGLLAAPYRALAEQHAAGRVDALRVHTPDGALDLHDWGLHLTTSDLERPTEHRYFAGTAALGYKAGTDLGVLGDESGPPGGHTPLPSDASRTLAALDTLGALGVSIARRALADGQVSLADQVGRTVTRMRALGTLMRARMGPGAPAESIVPIPLTVEEAGEGGHRPRPAVTDPYTLREQDAPRKKTRRPRERPDTSTTTRRVGGSRQNTVRSTVLAIFSVLIVTGAVTFHYLAFRGSEFVPAPTAVTQEELDRVLVGTRLVAAVSAEDRADPGFAKIVLGSGWKDLDERARRRALFGLCQVLGGHGYQRAEMVDRMARAAGTWSAGRIELVDVPLGAPEEPVALHASEADGAGSASVDLPVATPVDASEQG